LLNGVLRCEIRYFTAGFHKIKGYFKPEILKVNLQEMSNMLLVLKKGASKKEIEQINKQLRQMPSRKKLDAKKYCDVIKLKEDPLVIQKRLRDEWE
jgi:hypothetical protein